MANIFDIGILIEGLEKVSRISRRMDESEACCDEWEAVREMSEDMLKVAKGMAEPKREMCEDCRRRLVRIEGLLKCRERLK
jgi:hypothetical protein